MCSFEALHLLMIHIWINWIWHSSSFSLLRICSDDNWKMAFNTPLGHFDYLVIPFDLTNALAVFQALVNDVLLDMLNRFLFVYIDDILIFSKRHWRNTHSTSGLFSGASRKTSCSSRSGNVSSTSPQSPHWVLWCSRDSSLPTQPRCVRWRSGPLPPHANSSSTSWDLQIFTDASFASTLSLLPLLNSQTTGAATMAVRRPGGGHKGSTEAGGGHEGSAEAGGGHEGSTEAEGGHKSSTKVLSVPEGSTEAFSVGPQEVPIGEGGVMLGERDGGSMRPGERVVADGGGVRSPPPWHASPCSPRSRQTTTESTNKGPPAPGQGEEAGAAFHGALRGGENGKCSGIASLTASPRQGSPYVLRLSGEAGPGVEAGAAEYFTLSPQDDRQRPSLYSTAHPWCPWIRLWFPVPARLGGLWPGGQVLDFLSPHPGPGETRKDARRHPLGGVVLSALKAWLLPIRHSDIHLNIVKWQN